MTLTKAQLLALEVMEHAQNLMRRDPTKIWYAKAGSTSRMEHRWDLVVNSRAGESLVKMRLAGSWPLPLAGHPGRWATHFTITVKGSAELKKARKP